MPLTTELFQMFPWVGGLNTSLNPAAIEPNELVQADNLVFGTRGSRKKREGINNDWDDQSNGSDSVIGLYDFWYGLTSRTQKRVAVWDTGAIYTYSDSGVRSSNIFAGTAWASAITKTSFEVLNNLLIIAVDGTGNVLKKYDGSTVADLGGTPPQASIVRLHQGRLWTNDKTSLDRIHYSPVSDPSTWNGSGDSGAFDVGKGDGDPDGITAIFSFKGDLFVAKRTKLYRISGYSPEEYVIQLISNGIGCVAHNSVTTIDQDDVFFVSERGVHSLAATANYGDFASSFLSAPIQETFNNDFTRSRLQFIQSLYLPNINSFAFAVTDENTSALYNSALYLYNIPLKAWYRWPDLSCECIAVFRDSDQLRPYLGRNDGRVAKGMNGLVYDSDTAGTSTAISMIIKTGVIHPSQVPFANKGFKKFSLIYAPDGDHDITATVKIDNYPSQDLVFNEAYGDQLDVDFILDASALATGAIVAPYTLSVDGYGRAFQLTLTQEGVNERAEIQGFAVEYETAGLMQEVIVI